MENRDLKVEYTLDESKPYTIRAEGAVPVVEVELEGKNGLRVMWKGPHSTIVEMKFGEDGEWQEIPGIQELEVIMSAKEPLPIIKINQLIIPGIQERKIQGRKMTSLFIDEARKDACASDSGNEPDSSSD